MFKKNLRSIRLKQGITQKQVADCLNVSVQSISKWEKGDALPSIEFLPKMAECLKCEINDFFASNSESEYDIEMLKNFFEFMIEHLETQGKDHEKFFAFYKQHPDMLEVAEKLCADFNQCQTIKPKNLQGIIGCSKDETELFLNYFLKLELIEKLDTENSFFVLKSNFDGLRMVIAAWIEVCNVLEKNKMKANP